MRSIIPSVDEVLRSPSGELCTARFGRQQTVRQIRSYLASVRSAFRDSAGGTQDRSNLVCGIANDVLLSLETAHRSAFKPVINLTGTVLHTNLGRAVFAESAIDAATRAMGNPLALEYDLKGGKRGQRDQGVETLITELTGAEAACLVNNNAAAIMLVLATLASRKETIVSRGELIEIGGSFRLPDVMLASGTILREVGTTNRTHLKDYRGALSPTTGLLLKAHTSNFEITGFTKEVSIKELASLAREVDVPLVDDLGSGTLVDLSKWGLSKERTVQNSLLDGADLVTFSGDKLLGGPQAGFVVGRRDLVKRCADHPIKRAVRLDKVRLTALEATLMMYRNPDSLDTQLPTLRHLARKPNQMLSTAQSLAAKIEDMTALEVHVVDTHSQYGSGAVPTETIPSVGLSLPAAGGAADRLASAFRRLPVPVIGRIEMNALRFDLRCLDDEADILSQLAHLDLTDVWRR